MKNIIPIILIFLSLSLYAQSRELHLSTDIYMNQDEIFYSHQGPGRYDSTLAMSVVYAPVVKLREQIENHIGKKLDFFKKWNPHGEAHVTVITPVEYFDVLKEKISMTEIERLADRYLIQDSRLSMLGLGSAKKTKEGQDYETYFIIVDSDNLRHIRMQIYWEFVRRGGHPAAFDPTWFFPHITVGYLSGDLHIEDGVLKNVKHSLDPRFKLKVRP